jgi:hypothetical protein
MTVVCDGGAGAQAGVRHRDGSKTCRSNRAPGNTRRGLISCLSAAPLITPGISLNPRLCSLMVRKWSTVPISLSYTTPGISTRENTCSPTLCALPVNACTCVRTASHLWSDGSPGLTVRVFQRAGDILMVPGAGLQPQPDVSCRMGRRHCPSCDRVDGADGVLTQQAATGSPIQFRAPTQRVEGRECVPHDCGAVRMCACQGLEQGGRTGRRCGKPGCCVQYSVSLGTAVHTSLNTVRYLSLSPLIAAAQHGRSSALWPALLSSSWEAQVASDLSFACATVLK